ncbi:hypothetical protein D0Z07_8688 [Hyphodiscus hymeniophilus]|uniref:Uncharacterized protein n=1 Tax=Hyphodiscus hymeniophilus TaxID=353542 RepID=A0A9P6SLJ9_9HELO|nr:hypothetical protein D0Z07_8688 [Hyphodiscus hymeniophilus]
MDGDATAKTLDRGANSAIRNTEGSDSIHESSHQAVRSALPHTSNVLCPEHADSFQTALGEKTQGTGTSAFSKDGAIGSMFKADGAIGGTAEKIGGPLSQDGVIGKNFTEKGSIGGTVQETIGKSE